MVHKVQITKQLSIGLFDLYHGARHLHFANYLPLWKGLRPEESCANLQRAESLIMEGDGGRIKPQNHITEEGN